MAFWGVEVKPGKPYTHSSNGGRGRLRISQATLAIGSSENKSLVQCNVGDKSPVLLCALLPEKTESLHLDLEFEEAEEVLFSVIGPRGVYLTGYYVGKSARSYLQDDTESFGEDIVNSGSEESNHLSDDDKYEDSFINDDEPEVATSLSTSSDRVDDEAMDKKKGRNREGNHKRLRRRCQSVVSDDETSPKQQNTRSKFKIFTESDDEDNLLISSICKDKPEAAGRKSKKGTVPVDKKVKEHDGGNAKREADNAPVAGSIGKVDMEVIDDGTKRGFGITNDPEEDMKTKRKKKKHSKKDKDTEAKDGHLVSLKEGNRHQVETEAEADTIYHDVLLSKDDQRPNSNLEINHLHGSSLLSADVPSEKSPKTKRKRKNQPEVKGDSKGNDLLAEGEQDQKPRTNKSDSDLDQLTDENQSAEKKAKKKRRKKSRNEHIEGNTLK